MTQYHEVGAMGCSEITATIAIMLVCHCSWSCMQPHGFAAAARSVTGSALSSAGAANVWHRIHRLAGQA